MAACPTQFQQYIDGIDHRVHVIGDTVLACRIDSTAIDYRYPAASGGTTAMSAVILRDDVEQRCRDLAHGLGLSLAGIDLKLDRHGRWWCLEVNTAPGFIWFEAHTGLPISNAVANLLVNGAASALSALPAAASPPASWPTTHTAPPSWCYPDPLPN